jgi:hypothetical protein
MASEWDDDVEDIWADHSDPWAHEPGSFPENIFGDADDADPAADPEPRARSIQEARAQSSMRRRVPRPGALGDLARYCVELLRLGLYRHAAGRGALAAVCVVGAVIAGGLVLDGITHPTRTKPSVLSAAAKRAPRRPTRRRTVPARPSSTTPIRSTVPHSKSPVRRRREPTHSLRRHHHASQVVAPKPIHAHRPVRARKTIEPTPTQPSQAASTMPSAPVSIPESKPASTTTTTQPVMHPAHRAAASSSSEFDFEQ